MYKLKFNHQTHRGFAGRLVFIAGKSQSEHTNRDGQKITLWFRVVAHRQTFQIKKVDKIGTIRYPENDMGQSVFLPSSQSSFKYHYAHDAKELISKHLRRMANFSDVDKKTIEHNGLGWIDWENISEEHHNALLDIRDWNELPKMPRPRKCTKCDHDVELYPLRHLRTQYAQTWRYTHHPAAYTCKKCGHHEKIYTKRDIIEQ